MTDRQSFSPPAADGGTVEHFANRYALGEVLGRGGMAVVHAATDVASGQKVAVKQLIPRESGRSQAAIVSLFEQEFHVLSEVAHPHVVGVFDYGVSGGTPYYAMELLDGGDLAERSPMPAVEVCQVFRDVCSVMALLHSRRLVYRDLNPRNVRCTRSGEAKLIDFGAMVPMGPASKLIGTLGYVAPEFLHQQSVDGRADLYAVGACMYYALTGRAPHRAHNFAELSLAVLTPPPRPSEIAEAIPPALDELVMELLQVDPTFRPAAASEVIERLTAIGQLPEDATLPAAGAFLVTPPLVGRDRLLTDVRSRLASARQGKGSSVLYETAAGAGRSRMVEAAALEAKLSGVLAARADAGDADAGDYGVVDALAHQLLQLHPEASALARPHAAVFGHVLPSMRRAHGDVPLQVFDDPRARRPAVQAALRAWLSSLALAHPIALAVDDVHRIDEPSLALLALVAAECAALPLVLVLSAEQGVQCANPATFSTLREHAKVRPLDNLSREETQSLLAATFGDSAKLALLSDRVFSICRGNPRGVMQLAQFVVNQGIVRFEGGRWLLPQKLDASVLPRSAEEASVGILAGLSEPARALARLLSVSTLPALTFEDCLELGDGLDRPATLRVLGELVSAGVVRAADARYSLSRPMWADAAMADMNAVQTRALHGRVAGMMARRDHPTLFRLHHLRHAGEIAAAVDAMIAFCRESIARTDSDPDAYHALVESLPEGWYSLFDWAIKAAQERQLPVAHLCVMRQRLAGLLGLDTTASSEHVALLLAQLRCDVGLDFYAALAAEGREPAACLQGAFEQAQARYDAAAEDERWLAPLAAVRTLMQTEIAAAGMVVPGMDYRLLGQIPDVRPLELLAPAIGVVRRLIDGLRHRMAGRLERAQEVYDELLERMSGPDNGGIDPTHAAYTRFGVIRGLGMMDAAIGHDRALERADALAQTPLLAVNARLIRMLHCYFDARPHDGDALKRELVLERIGASAVQWHEGSHLVAEVVAHAAARDAPRLRETLRELEVHAGRHAGWQPVMRYGEAELLRLKGKHATAVSLLSSELAQTSAGGHQLWCNLAGAHVTALCAHAKADEAVTCGERYLREAIAAEQGINAVFIQLPLAEARLATGDLHGAWSEVNRVLDQLVARGVRGLLLGWASEVAAQVSTALGEVDRARLHIHACDVHLRASDNRAGRARCQRLRRSIGDASWDDRNDDLAQVEQMQSQIRSEILRGHPGPLTTESWRQALLARVLDETEAEAAALFMRTQSDLEPAVAVEVRAGERIATMRALAQACYTRYETSASLGSEEAEELETATELGFETEAFGMEAVPLTRTGRADAPGINGVVVLAGARVAVRPYLLEAIGRLLEAAPPVAVPRGDTGYG